MTNRSLAYCLLTGAVVSLAAGSGGAEKAAEEMDKLHRPPQVLPADAPVDKIEGLPATWMNKPPADCPFPQSTDIVDIKRGWFVNYYQGEFSDKTYTKGVTKFDGRVLYGDSYYVSWAADGNLYSMNCDPHNLWMIKGDDPTNLQWKNVKWDVKDFFARHKRSGFSDGARGAMSRPVYYFCASLVHNGVWYLGGESRYHHKTSKDCQGWFTGFWVSQDLGKSWSDEMMPKPGDPLWPEKDKYENVKLAIPHFVDFGKNMMHSPDGKAYITAHGSANGRSYWERNDEIYLVRVTPSPKMNNDHTAYEYFAGHDEKTGEAKWSKLFDEMKPMIEWPDKVDNHSMTYNPVLKKYIMVVDFEVRKFNGADVPAGHHHDAYILESDKVTGPWRIITYLERFGPGAYQCSFPTKLIHEDGKTMWMLFSANWRSPAGDGHKYVLRHREVGPNYGP